MCAKMDRAYFSGRGKPNHGGGGEQKHSAARVTAVASSQGPTALQSIGSHRAQRVV
jgi:hypothetical protein